MAATTIVDVRDRYWYRESFNNGILNEIYTRSWLHFEHCAELSKHQ